jgi:DNA transformation protein
MAYEELAHHCVELFEPLGAARSRRMFGGHGIYVDDLFVALIAYDRIYLKADDRTRPAFQAAGCEPTVIDWHPAQRRPVRVLPRDAAALGLRGVAFAADRLAGGFAALARNAASMARRAQGCIC